MPQIKSYEAGNLGLRPTETGVEARAGTARRIGAFYNQRAGAEETLARETERLAGETRSLGRETAQFGGETQRVGSEQQRLGSETGALGDFEGHLLTDTGRRIGSSVTAAGDAAVKYLDHEQINRGAPAFARLMEAKTTEWNEIAKTADPNDPTIKQRFMQGLEPELQKFKEDGFYTENGQKWAEAHIDALRTHMMEKTDADMATLAGHAAVVNQKQSMNSLSNTVRSDPSSMGMALATLESTTEGMIATSPNLSGTAAAKARSEILQAGKESIIKSAALGYIEKTGQVPSWVTDPKFAPYVNGAELKQLAQAAKYYERLGQSENRAQRVQADHEAKNDFNQKINALEAATMPQNAGDKPQLPADYWSKLRDLATHPGAALEPGRLATMVNKGEALTERLNKPEPLARVSHDATMNLLTDIRTGKITDTGPIYDAYQKGDLNNGDFNFLNQEFRTLRTPDGERLANLKQRFLHGVEPSIDKSAFGIPDPDGKERFYQFSFQLDRKMAEYRKSGKDPYDLLDPSKPDYMGKPEALKPYTGPLNQQLKDAIERAGGLGAKPAPAAPRVTTKEEFDKLPSGADYISKDGKPYRKP